MTSPGHVLGINCFGGDPDSLVYPGSFSGILYH